MVSTPLQTLGLKDAVTSIHHASPPNTYNQGQFPIDRIFLQAEWIPQVTGSYLAFDQGVPSDHRAIWVDLPIDLLGWSAPTTSVPIWARHLKCDDPHVVKHHNNILDEKVKKQGIYEVLNQLYVQTAGCQLLVTQQRCLEQKKVLTQFNELSNSPPWLSLRAPLFQSYPDSHGRCTQIT